MKIYLDVVFFLNFGFDFLLLMAVSLILRRNTKLRRILLGSFLGGLSIFTLFIPINSFQLFIIKIGISIVMILATFGYRNLKYTWRNFLYLYSTSLVLGGFLYFLNIQFSYKQEGLVFYHDGLSINFIFLVLTSPIIVYSYIRQAIYLKNNYANYYEVTLKHHDQKIMLTGFLDTGNQLVDPYLKRPIILIDRKKMIYDINEFQMILVPLHTANHDSLLSCFQVEEIYIKNIGYRNHVLIGLLDEKISIDGIDCILSPKALEG